MRNKLVPIILIVAVLGFVGFMTAGCSTSDDESTLEFYVTDVDPMAVYYEVGVSTSGAETDISVVCKYYGDSEVAPKGIFIKRITLIAEDTTGNAITAVKDLVVYTSYFVDVAGTFTVTFADILWPSLITWLDAQTPTSTQHMVIRIYFEGEDTAGNTLNASTYFTIWYY